jgi:hypothetical protein
MVAWQFRLPVFVEQRYFLNRFTKAKFQSINWFGIKSNTGGEDKLHIAVMHAHNDNEVQICTRTGIPSS